MRETKNLKKVIGLQQKRIEVLERLLNVYDNPQTPPSLKKTGRKPANDDEGRV
jgi:hypothetical protein